MSFSFSNLKEALLCAIAVAGVVSSVQAQQAGQPIVFSSPEDKAAASSETSASEDAPRRRNIVDPIQVPSSDFNMNRAASQMPRSTMRIPEKKERDDRNNWAFMTPAEILGVSTPQKLMGIPERDASGNRTDLTPQERYIERLGRTQPAYTNGFSPGNTTLSWKTGVGKDNPSVWDTPNPLDGNVGNSANLLNRFLNNAPNINNNNNWADNQNNDSSWSKLMGSPKSLTDFSPAQRTAMDQFKELLNPTPASVIIKPLATSNPKTQPILGFSSPLANPIGGSVTPVRSGVGLPSVLPTLPTITSQSAKPSLTPSWKTRRTESPDFTFPQRREY